jgi:predicted lipoprotein with Yx(FWY)xxD motif
MVVTGAGLTVYVYLSDHNDPPGTTCTGNCADDWPPVVPSGARPHLKGIKSSQVGVLTRPDHSRQLTFGGYPLYRFAGDQRPGDVYGEAIGGKWFAVAPDGAFLTLPPNSFQGLSTSHAGLRLVSIAAGSVVADGAGQTLYTYQDDTPGRSACVASWCTEDWPPVIVRQVPTAPTGMSAPLSLVKRPDGSLQLAIGGHPVYRFSGDDRPGDIRGLGIGGDWYPVAPNGVKITK